ncbi:MAG TPA: peptidoglycan recognition family protein [Planctomycetota bacterium]|nr:peptidoglycan recognition family protein [Planctomycetota bacterium]
MKISLLPCVLLIAAAAGGCAATSPPAARSGKAPPAASPAEAKAQPLLKQLQALADAGHHDQVIDRVDAELPKVSDAATRTRLQLLQARSLQADGKGRSAVLTFQRAVEDLPSTSGALACETLQSLADAQAALGRWRDAQKNYGRALDAGAPGARAKEELQYSAYVAAREAHDSSAASEWKGQIRRFSATRLASVESRLLPASKAPPAPAEARPLLPGELPDDPTRLLAGIHRRAEWSAAPVRANVDPMLPVTHVTVHHTAMDSTTTWPKAVASEIREIQAAHQEKGWADIGYHFLIDAGGGIWEGRPLRWQGAHEGAGLNRGAVGVCLLGNFDDQPVPLAQQAALSQLLDALCRQYALTANDIRTHREVRPDPTNCPGRALQAVVDRYRRNFSAASLARQ